MTLLALIYLLDELGRRLSIFAAYFLICIKQLILGCRATARLEKRVRVPPRPLSRIHALRGTCTSLCPAGGLLSLVCPRESNQREGHLGRSPRKRRAVPCAPRPTGPPLLALPL